MLSYKNATIFFVRNLSVISLLLPSFKEAPELNFVWYFGIYQIKNKKM